MKVLYSSATCTVAKIPNGFRSPTAGYTVGAGTKITTFCNTNYSIEHQANNKALCTATQPTCYGKFCQNYDVVHINGLSYQW